ncbi:hypothetical protein Zmor_020643 [Zophobas morio]|uniref:Fanconi-associated nuclease n=1 Tax=Zophobas morio TaxID=2755281 RepID=A0AA38I512_9CUCU|nr:hypothetical protein Zmor_020643 [Zophobas morio]
MSDASCNRYLPKKLNQTKISSYFTECIKTLPVESAKRSPSKGKRNLRSRRKLVFSSSSSADTEKSREINRKYLPTKLSDDMSSLIAEIPKRKLPAPIFSDDEDSENDQGTLNSPKKRGGDDVTTKQSNSVLISLNKPGPSKSPRKKFASSTPLRSSNLLTSSFNENLDVGAACSVATTSESISLNKPGPSKSPRKKFASSTPLRSSNLLTSSFNENLDVGASCSVATTSEDASVNESPKAVRAVKNVDGSPKAVRVLQNVVIQSPKKSPQKEPVKDETKKLNYEQLKVFREFFVNILKQNHLLTLLSSSDQQLLHKFFNIEKNYQYLCIKLFLWKPIWYNIFKYVEKIGLTMSDSEVTVMYDYLKDNGFVEIDYMREDLFTLLDLLSLKDLRDIGRSFKFPNVSGPKDIIVAKLIKNTKTQITLTSNMNAEDILRKRIKERMGFCVKLSTNLNKCLYFVYLLNTFSNSSLSDPHDYFKDVSFFNIVFPTYNIENFHIFYTPQEFARFADAVKLRSELEKVVEKRTLNHIFEICRCGYNRLKELNEEFGTSFDVSNRPPHLERFTPNAQYIYILSSGSKHITTTYFSHVVQWYEYLISQNYCVHKRGEWYEHLALVYTMYVKDYERAAKLIIKAFTEDRDHLSDIQLQELLHRGKMLNRKTYNLPPLYHDEIVSLSPPSCDRVWPQDVIDCKSMTSQEPGRRRMYAHQCENGDVNYLTVEQTALQYYRTVGFPDGEHCEGNLIIASFCLLFWDIIYEDYVKGTFVSKVQSAPLDMYSSHFYKNRERRIKRRLSDIEHKWTEEIFRRRLFDRWTLHSHETSLCSLDAVVDKPERLYNAITCIGRDVLGKIFERLVKNFKYYRSGFPDLIVWNLPEKKAKFVEVKSENDKLSIKQKLWLNYLIEIGANAAVCHVEPKSSKKKNRTTGNNS